MNEKKAFLVAAVLTLVGLSANAQQMTQFSGGPPIEGLHGPATQAIQAQIRKSRLRDPQISVFYGDVTGQGTNDAISLIYHQSEGNSHELATWIWREQNGTYALARAVRINELFGSNPRNVKFSPDRISVTTTVPKADDPSCCPTGIRTFSLPVR